MARLFLIEPRSILIQSSFVFSRVSCILSMLVLWIGTTSSQGTKFNFLSREGQIFPGGRILKFSPENAKYRKLICVKLLFSYK